MSSDSMQCDIKTDKLLLDLLGCQKKLYVL